MSRKTLRDLRGQRFGRLAVLDEEPERKRRVSGVRRRIFWHCRCDCTEERWVQQDALLQGNVVSCGCYRRELLVQRATTHGGSASTEYSIWVGMVTRCYNPNATSYEHYGGRGITVCDAWRNSFAQFLVDMGSRPSPHHSLERRRNDLGYTPGNTYWADIFTQANNRRNSRMLTYQGRTQTMAQWGRETGVRGRVLWDRLDKLGWSVEKALTTPVRPQLPSRR